MTDRWCFDDLTRAGSSPAIRSSPANAWYVAELVGGLRAQSLHTRRAPARARRRRPERTALHLEHLVDGAQVPQKPHHLLEPLNGPPGSGLSRSLRVQPDTPVRRFLLYVLDQIPLQSLVSVNQRWRASRVGWSWPGAGQGGEEPLRCLA